ncbi:MAG: response regulator [Pseudomonadota bacterium]
MGISIAFDSMSFLVVDDNAYMRTILRTILSSFGARKIYEAENGADGLEKLKAFSPDIAIIDWEMPVMNGPDMIRTLRNPDECNQAFVPVILLTAHTERHRIMQARNFGAHEILRKPVSPNAIYQRIASIILQPRPFIRTSNYFGPELRGELGAAVEDKKKEIYADKRDDASETNIDDYEDSSAAPVKAESAA